MSRRVQPLTARLWRNVYVTDDCWEWRGWVTREGYGMIRSGLRGTPLMSTHRLAYELLVGPIPEGLVIDHLCRNRICCRPDHLETVTVAQNNQRGMAPSHVAARSGMCVKGLHALSGDNLYVGPRGGRRCRACQHIRQTKERES